MTCADRKITYPVILFFKVVQINFVDTRSCWCTDRQTDKPFFKHYYVEKVLGFISGSHWFESQQWREIFLWCDFAFVCYGHEVMQNKVLNLKVLITLLFCNFKEADFRSLEKLSMAKSTCKLVLQMLQELTTSSCKKLHLQTISDKCVSENLKFLFSRDTK